MLLLTFIEMSVVLSFNPVTKTDRGGQSPSGTSNIYRDSCFGICICFHKFLNIKKS